MPENLDSNSERLSLKQIKVEIKMQFVEVLVPTAPNSYEVIFFKIPFESRVWSTDNLIATVENAISRILNQNPTLGFLLENIENVMRDYGFVESRNSEELQKASLEREINMVKEN